MKTNELMIGDWVYASGYIKSNMQISGVRQFDVDGDRIFKDDVRHTTMFIPYKNLEPIHLTTEILEKNGFEISGEYSECVADGLFVDVPIWSYEAEDIYISWAGVELYISYNLGMPCNEIKLYQPKVHELQHALRLCGLTDLADNFKV